MGLRCLRVRANKGIDDFAVSNLTLYSVPVDLEASISVRSKIKVSGAAFCVGNSSSVISTPSHTRRDKEGVALTWTRIRCHHVLHSFWYGCCSACLAIPVQWAPIHSYTQTTGGPRAHVIEWLVQCDKLRSSQPCGPWQTCCTCHPKGAIP